jgi:hypothetical protein
LEIANGARPVQDQRGQLLAVAGYLDCLDGLLRLGDMVPDLHSFSAVLFSVDQYSDFCQVPGQLRERECAETNEQIVGSVRLVPGRERYGDERAGSQFVRSAAFRSTRHKVIDGCLAVDRTWNGSMATGSLKSRGSIASSLTRSRCFTSDLYIDDMRTCVSVKKTSRAGSPIARRYAFVGHLRNAGNTAAVIELLASIIPWIMPEVRRARYAINRHRQRAGSATKQQGPPNKANPKCRNMGQTRTLCHIRAKSVHPLTADVWRLSWQVRLVP